MVNSFESTGFWPLELCSSICGEELLIVRSHLIPRNSTAGGYQASLCPAFSGLINPGAGLPLQQSAWGSCASSAVHFWVLTLAGY